MQAAESSRDQLDQSVDEAGATVLLDRPYH
jgi:hypothetical protein